MLTLSKTSLLYKWAYLLTESWVKPDEGAPVDLCRIFWRVVFFTPIKVGCIGVILFILISVLFVVPFKAMGWMGLLLTPVVTSVMVLVSYIQQLVKKGIERFTHRQRVVSEPSMVVEFIKGVKHKYCPIVIIK